MKVRVIAVSGLFVLVATCGTGKQQIMVRLPAVQQHEQASVEEEIERDRLVLFDTLRNRHIPVALYFSNAKKGSKKLKIAILNHGYRGANTDYSFIASILVAQGYFVASIQHELPGDEPLAMTGNLYETRMPAWERGVQNILFTLQELKRIRPELAYAELLLLGHSNGGDIAMLFAHRYPELVQSLISLDNRRMPFPRAARPRVLSLRSSDQRADDGVLPTLEEQKQFGITISPLPNVIHNDMWDGATQQQKEEMKQFILKFLKN